MTEFQVPVYEEGCPIVRISPEFPPSFDGRERVCIKADDGWRIVFAGPPEMATIIYDLLRRSINEHVKDYVRQVVEEIEQLHGDRVTQLEKERDALNTIVENLQSAHDKIDVPGVGFCTNLGGEWVGEGQFARQGWLLPRKPGQRDRREVEPTILDAVRIGIREEQERKEQEDAKSGSAGATDQGSNEDQQAAGEED